MSEEKLGKGEGAPEPSGQPAADAAPADAAGNGSEKPAPSVESGPEGKGGYAAGKPPRRRKALKALKWIGIALVVLVLLLLVLRDIIVQGAVPKVGELVTGTKVTLGSFSSSFDGRVRMERLMVGNPPGYERANALELGSISVKVNLKSLFSDRIEVDEIIIKGLKTNYEVRVDGSSNLTDIEENINHFCGKPAPGAEEGRDGSASGGANGDSAKGAVDDSGKASKDDSAGSGSGGEGQKDIVIHLVRVTDCSFSVASKMLESSVELAVPPIELTEIGGGSSVGEAIHTLYEQILLVIFKGAGVAVDKLGDLGAAFKGAGSNLLESVQQGAKPAGEVIGRLGDVFLQQKEKAERQEKSPGGADGGSRKEGGALDGLMNLFRAGSSEKGK